LLFLLSAGGRARGGRNHPDDRIAGSWAGIRLESYIIGRN